MPTFDNFNDRIVFSSDNTDVALVVGTPKAVLVSAVNPGLALIKARIPSLEQETTIAVNVVEEITPDTLRIVTPVTTFAFNPRSNPERIVANIAGLGVDDTFLDDIIWIVNGDGLDVINIFPKRACNTCREANCLHCNEYGVPFHAKGREVQVSPLPLNNKDEMKTATITIGHKYVNPNFWRTIHFSVSEMENALTLNKSHIEMRGSVAETLQATIVGARTNDYNDLLWTAKMGSNTDGTEFEVVRIMGEGRNVMIYPMNEGDTEIIAYYKGLFRVCTVKVTSDYILKFHVQAIEVFPGETENVYYDLRPTNSIVSWIESGSFNQTDPMFYYR